MAKIDYDAILAEWEKRIDVKTKGIENSFDQGLLKAAIYCNEEALKNAMEKIYNNPIPTLHDGTKMWRRTGLYKGAMGYSMDPNKKHTALIFNTAPYANVIEFGDSKGRQGKSILSNAVFNNKPEIKSILESYLKEAVR